MKEAPWALPFAFGHPEHQTWEPRPDVSGDVGMSALLLGLTRFLTTRLPVKAGSNPPEKSPLMELRATTVVQNCSRPCLPHCRASCHRAGCHFRQMPLTLLILVLVPYGFLISDNAICHKSLNIRIGRHMKRSFSDATKQQNLPTHDSLLSLLVHLLLGGAFQGIKEMRVSCCWALYLKWTHKNFLQILRQGLYQDKK